MTKEEFQDFVLRAARATNLSLVEERNKGIRKFDSKLADLNDAYLKVLADVVYYCQDRLEK